MVSFLKYSGWDAPWPPSISAAELGFPFSSLSSYRGGHRMEELVWPGDVSLLVGQGPSALQKRYFSSYLPVRTSSGVGNARRAWDRGLPRHRIQFEALY
jgi:hypothetical protein